MTDTEMGAAALRDWPYPSMEAEHMDWTQMLTAAIESMPSDFDSHDVINKVAHTNQRAYIERLYANVSGPPFQTVHATLGREIARICSRLGYERVDRPGYHSKDIFRQNSECALWCKPATSGQ
jgi:hypothetical protein